MDVFARVELDGKHYELALFGEQLARRGEGDLITVEIARITTGGSATTDHSC